MADKFLSREDGKQKILGIDLARVETKDGERAVVVTAEIDRFTVFWTKADGSWSQLSRKHDPLEAKPSAPVGAARLGWSSRIGIASTQGRLHLFYKRRFDGDTADRLYVDVLNFDDASESFVAETPAAPRVVPLALLDYAQPGLSLWADARDNELLVVVQLLPAPSVILPPTPPILPPIPPRIPGAAPAHRELVLLRAKADADLTDAAQWTTTVLDKGDYDAGFDFDARREGDQLGVVHRRRAAMFATEIFLPLDPGFSPLPPLQFSDLANDAPPLLRDMAVPLVFVEMNLATDAIAIDDTLPFAEHPQLHGLAPVIITGDHLRSARIGLSDGVVEPQQFNGFKELIMRDDGAWRAGQLPSMHTHFAPSTLPLNLEATAGAQALFAMGPPIPGRAAPLEFAGLMGLAPVALLDLTETSKGWGLIFLHARREFDGIAATRFDVGATSATGLAITASGFSLTDINHARLSDDIEAPENEQFEPFKLRRIFDEGGLKVRGPGVTENRLGGLITAHRDAPHTFCAYVDMGDGGGRVVYAPDLALPPVDTPVDLKELTQEAVPDSGESGRIFVKVEGADFQPLSLPAYLIPSAPAAPPAIVSGAQPLLDALSTAAITLFTAQGALDGGSLTLGADGAPLQVVLSESTAGQIEVNLFAPPGSTSATFTSDDDQPFTVRMRFGPSPLFCGKETTFRAFVNNPPPGALTIAWTFSDGQTAAGSPVALTFAPPAGVTPRLPLELDITLTVTAADGRTATVTHHETVPASFWTQITAPIDGLNFTDTDDDDVPDAPIEFQLKNAELTFSRYVLTFTTDDDLAPSNLQIDYLDTHDGAFRFRGSDGQGQIEERTDVAIASDGVIVNGWLGAIIKVKSIGARFRVTRRYTPGILTSDTRGGDDPVETVQSGDTPLPNALACKPVGDPVARPIDQDTKVDAVLADTARYSTWLIMALAAMLPAGLLIGLLLPLLIVLFPVAAVSLLIAAGASAILSALLAAGFGWFITDVVGPFVVSWIATDQLRIALGSEDTRKKISDLALFTNAGEGLAEEIAQRAIVAANDGNAGIAPPATDGRDRARPQLFETIVVTEGLARVKMNVGRG